MYLDYYGFKVANLMISFFIVVFNIVIRTFNIAIIDKIGFDKKSSETKYIMKAILFASFLNTGLLLLFSDANFEFAPWIFKEIPLRRLFVDMNYNWYLDISISLVFAMLITAVFPWLEFFIFGGIR